MLHVFLQQRQRVKDTLGELKAVLLGVCKPSVWGDLSSLSRSAEAEGESSEAENA